MKTLILQADNKEYALIREALCAKIATEMAEAREWEIAHSGVVDIFETADNLLTSPENTLRVIKQSDEQRRRENYEGLELSVKDLLLIGYALEREEVRLMYTRLGEEEFGHVATAKLLKIRQDEILALCARITQMLYNGIEEKRPAMRWEDFENAENGMLKTRNVDGWAFWAKDVADANHRAPADYGIVTAAGGDDEDRVHSGQIYIAFKTSDDRDLYQMGY